MKVPKPNNPPADGDGYGYSARKPSFVLIPANPVNAVLVVVAVLLSLVRALPLPVLRMPPPRPQNRLQFPSPWLPPKLVRFLYR
jgi:hypothetical protein